MVLTIASANCLLSDRQYGTTFCKITSQGIEAIMPILMSNAAARTLLAIR